MKLTNKPNVPDHLYQRIWDDLHRTRYEIPTEDQGKPIFSVTQLDNPPLVNTLWKEYFDSDELVCDVADFLHMIIGSAYHHILQGEDTDTIRHEVTMITKLVLPDGREVIVCGTVDHEEITDVQVIISDHKTCVATNVGFDTKDSYVNQLNKYKFFGHYEELGKPIKLMNRYYVKDWSPKLIFTNIKGNPYPKCPYIEKEVEVMSDSDIQDMLISQITDQLDNPKRPCTLAERCFNQQDRIEYAVMVEGRVYKSGAKKGQPNTDALKVFKVADGQSEQDAQAYLSTLPPAQQANAYINVRNADQRCKYYCNVASVCPYARSMGYVK